MLSLMEMQCVNALSRAVSISTATAINNTRLLDPVCVNALNRAVSISTEHGTPYYTNSSHVSMP